MFYPICKSIETGREYIAHVEGTDSEEAAAIHGRHAMEMSRDILFIKTVEALNIDAARAVCNA